MCCDNSMQLTKFTHSCVRITDDGDRRLVIDPGSFSEVEQALEGVDHVLFSHLHPDHIDVAKLRTAAVANRNLRVWAPADLAAQLSAVKELENRVTTVGPGESFDAGGLPIRTFGGQHALIHSSVPVISNVAYLVGGAIYHPGDSYVVPTADVEYLLVPLTAPWTKVAETIDFTVSVRARRASGIHDAGLNEIGRDLYSGLVLRANQTYGVTEYVAMTPGETVTI
jgi:L-ascorbate metabolism protein UlaG (beta-lactamase superfamily)